MKSILALTFAVLLFAASCTAPSGHRNQSWHPTSPKKAKQGHNR
jgi:hypothetical protein